MKRFFALTMTLCTLLFVACEEGGKTTDPESKAKLTRTSAAIMEFDAAGGEGEITYTIENPENGVQVRAQCAAEWIDGLTTGEKVTFIVEENTTGESRLATIEVTYGDDCQFEVTISQKAGSGNTGGNGGGSGDYAEKTMNYITGEYYGTQYSGNTYNYFVALHKEPLDEDGYVQGVALVLDLYSSTSGEGTNFVVPNGTYTFDPQATLAAGTVADGYSYYTTENVELINIADATVEVSDNKIEAWVALTNGESVHVVYEGSLVCYDSSEESGGGDDYYYYSNLTEDYSFGISGGNAYGWADFYGDCYNLGINNFYLDLYEDSESGNGLNILLDIFTNATSTDIVGTYTPYYTSESDEYTFIEGYVDDEGYLVGSWIVTLEDEYISESEPFAPLTFGSVTITATGKEGAYTVTLDCTDDLDHKISGTYTGEILISDLTSSTSYAAPQKAAKKAVGITQKTAKIASQKLHRIDRR